LDARIFADFVVSGVADNVVGAHFDGDGFGARQE